MCMLPAQLVAPPSSLVVLQGEGTGDIVDLRTCALGTNQSCDLHLSDTAKFNAGLRLPRDVLRTPDKSLAKFDRRCC